MMNSRASLYVTTALGGGVLAALLAPAAARAQCVTPPSTFTQNVDNDGFITTTTVTTPGFQSLGAGSVNALSSVVSTLSVLESAQGSSPFVVANPTQAPDQQGGGVWARGIGGSVRVKAPTNGVSFDSFPQANGTSSSSVDCQASRVRQGFAGAQVGADVANLNLGGGGGTLHVGLTSGFLETSATTSDSLTNIKFQVPFFGAYATLTHGNFFADAQIRGNFYEGSITDAATSIAGQKFNATGFTLGGNLGYHYNLPSDWFIEPSIGVNWSRTFIDPMNFSSFATVITTPPPPPPVTSTALSNLRINDFDSILGRAGLRVGTTLVNGQYIFQPYFTASVFHEFAGHIGSTLNTTLTGLPAPLPSSIFEATFFSTSRIGTYGQFGLGVASQIANSGWTSFVRGDYLTGSRFEGWDVTGGVRYDFNPETGPVVQGRSADLAGAPHAPPPYNWSGFFLGVSAPGALWGETKWSFAGAAGSAANNYSGVLAGGGGGYNYQMGALVIGGQVEWDWTNARGGESFNCLANGVFFNNCETRVNSIFTATARAGYALDRLLVYGQGGLAVGDVIAKLVSNSLPGKPTSSDGKTAVGWTIGAGFEFGLTQNISAKAEYLYFDLGSDTYNLGVPVAINRTGNIGRVGLNYRFNLM